MDHVSQNFDNIATTNSRGFDAAFHFSAAIYNFDQSLRIDSLFNQVVMGGGQEAMEVTTTSTRIGKFEAR